MVDQPQSGARYPVQWEVQTPVGTYTVNALLDAQELDSSASTGAVYWEGLSDLTHANGQAAGRGYLEMTGYTRLCGCSRNAFGPTTARQAGLSPKKSLGLAAAGF